MPVTAAEGEQQTERVVNSNNPAGSGPGAGRTVVRRFGQARRRGIAEYVDGRGSASVEELARHFGVSAVTVRTDLEALAQEGQLQRTHGGALALPAEGEDSPPQAPFTTRMGQQQEQKLRIAAAAAAMIRDGDTVILDSGTTMAALAQIIRGLPLSSLTVVTNAINVAAELTDAAHVRVLVLGGVLQPLSHSLVGADAEAALSRVRADLCFLGADGVDVEFGISTADPAEAQLNVRMIEASQRTVALADASKLGRRSLARIAPLSALHAILTDHDADQARLQSLRADVSAPPIQVV